MRNLLLKIIDAVLLLVVVSAIFGTLSYGNSLLFYSCISLVLIRFFLQTLTEHDKD